MSEATQPLKQTAEQYREAAHHWQKKWDERRAELSATREAVRTLLNATPPIATGYTRYHEARANVEAILR